MFDLASEQLVIYQEAVPRTVSFPSSGYYLRVTHCTRPVRYNSDLLATGSPLRSSTKTDRPYCGAGPSGRNRGGCGPLNKSNSLDASSQPLQAHRHGQLPNGTHNHVFRRSPATSQSSGIGSQRHGINARAVALDDCGSRADRWRRNGAANGAQSYELSQDLADKRLEMLERRYGGDRARRAATIIQRAYRHYAMHKKFRAIKATAKAQEKRLSRRFTIESSEWGSDALRSIQDAEKTMRSELELLNREIKCAAYIDSHRPSRSLSMRTTTCSRPMHGPPIHGPSEVEYLNDSSLYCQSEHLLSPSGPINISGITDVNSYASSKEMKFLASEDSGFGSQDTISSKASQGSKNRNAKVSICKKAPPDLPRRSSSIKSSESSGSVDRSADNGSLSSVQSSGSDSSLSQSASDRGTPVLTHDTNDHSELVVPTSPIWKRKAQPCLIDPSINYQSSQMSQCELEDKRLSNISENSEDSFHSHSSEGITYSHGTHTARYAHNPHSQSSFSSRQQYKVSDVFRKRQYRVGLNLFNKKPERGITYLINKGFIDGTPQAVSKFLLTRKGLSKQMIGEYLGNLQSSFCMAALECFATEVDLSGMQVDVALRKFQAHFRMPGEAQKIERLMQVFAQRYCQCNRDIIAKLRDQDTVFVLAFAIIMLNTDLHTAALKPERRMKMEEFIKNLRAVDDGCDIEMEMLEGMYHRIKSQEFKAGHDHVTQVLKVQQTIVGKKPVLALPHRRLVCYCRLYEISDVNKKERPGIHQREVFLFNDLLVVTKIMKRNKNSVTYTFRESFALAGLSVATKESTIHAYLLEIRQRVDSKLLVMFNARNEHDKTKFCEDLRESILEMDEMETLRIEGELERQKANMRASRPNSTAENRDSGVADMEIITTGEKNYLLKPEGSLRKTTLSNSLLDIHEAGL